MTIAHPPSRLSRWGRSRLLAHAGGAALATFASTSAMAITLAFSGSGAVTGPAQTPPVLTGLMLTAATSSYTIGVDDSWHVDKLFSFDTAMLVGGGTFTFSNGASSFGGTFTSSRASSTSPTSLFYTVTEGTGAYANYAGVGFAYGSTLGNPFSLPGGTVSFTEGGIFNINALPVPEPASALLLVLGLGTTLLWRRRSAGGSTQG